MARAGNYHDIGGQASAPVESDERPLTHWQWESEAVRYLMGSERHPYLTLDELRRVFEEFGEDLYSEGFHERRTHAMIHLLIEKGVITQAELDAKVAQVAERLERQAQAGS
ncbi:MAG: nitrile hydratase [Pseudomonadota bacterium]